MDQFLYNSAYFGLLNIIYAQMQDGKIPSQLNLLDVARHHGATIH
jgi:hypothetical protein